MSASTHSDAVGDGIWEVIGGAAEGVGGVDNVGLEFADGAEPGWQQRGGGEGGIKVICAKEPLGTPTRRYFKNQQPCGTF